MTYRPDIDKIAEAVGGTEPCEISPAVILDLITHIKTVEAAADRLTGSVFFPYDGGPTSAVVRASDLQALRELIKGQS
jgi:hypothetical protein